MANPLYGQNKADNILDQSIKNTGWREITVVTAGDDSHTLTAADGGTILISAALASGAVIKLPEASQALVGLKFHILFSGTMAAACSIKLKDGNPEVFAGVVHARRCGNAAGVTDGQQDSGTTGVVNATTIVCTVAAGEQALALDENDVSFGGGIGTDLVFEYVSPTVVFVTGSININVADTAVDPVLATSFTATGY